MWLVYGYRHLPETTYTGPKKRPNIVREFEDEPSAHRYAKDLVERINSPVIFAEVFRP